MWWTLMPAGSARRARSPQHVQPATGSLCPRPGSAHQAGWLPGNARRLGTPGEHEAALIRNQRGLCGWRGQRPRQVGQAHRRRDQSALRPRPKWEAPIVIKVRLLVFVCSFRSLIGHTCCCCCVSLPKLGFGHLLSACFSLLGRPTRALADVLLSQNLNWK